MAEDALERAIVSAALTWLGTPYRHQASRLGAGCDCLGLIRGVWRTLYGAEPVMMPPYSRISRDRRGGDQLLEAAKLFLINSDTNVLPGRVVLFRLHAKLPPRHCGIIVDENHFIHAQERSGVLVSRFDANWRRRIHSLFEFPQKVLK
jgi:NlpC/P60 family putative phage cell wall peptidase